MSARPVFYDENIIRNKVDKIQIFDKCLEICWKKWH